MAAQWLQAVAVAIAVAIAPGAASATRGKLNRCGCHNSKTHGYHCHQNLCPKPPAKPASAPARQPKGRP